MDIEEKNSENNDLSIEKDKRAKFTMDKKTFWIIAGIVIALLVILVVWQTSQINAISSAGSSVARTATTTVARASSGGMVGGC